jgi:hypothetical protein
MTNTTYRQDYCTQNNENCETCSLNNYDRDCQNNKITSRTDIQYWLLTGDARKNAEIRQTN